MGVLREFNFPPSTIDGRICNGLSLRTGSVGGMTRRFEQSPGSDVTLLALYDAVVAAEEFDLVEQARIEAEWASEDTSVVDEPTDDPRIDDAERPRMSQAVGLIEHLLGGQPIANT
jgi:hypothetical protein